MNKLILLLSLIAVLGFSPVSAQQAYNCPFGGGMMYGTYGGVGMLSVTNCINYSCNLLANKICK